MVDNGLLLLAVPLTLLLLEKPFGLISRLTNYFDNLWVFKEGFSLYDLFSFFIITGVWAFMLMYAPQVFAENANPLLANYLNGHWMSWIGLLAVVTYYGHFDFIKGVYVGAFIYSVHEIGWILTATSFYSNFDIMIHYWPLLVTIVFLLLGYFIAWRGLPLHKEVIVIAIIVVWDVLWAYAGLHTTVANWMPSPKTAYFLDPNVNIVEILSWVMPCLGALL